MSVAQPEHLPAEGEQSLEVRWIVAGQLDDAVAGWFARFPAEVESREDSYLVEPQLPGLSVKIRGAGNLDVKVYRGSPGILDIAGRARGRVESWQKWSFPHGLLHADSNSPPGWARVRKRRLISRFPQAGERNSAHAQGPGGDLPAVARELRCTVELTEVRARDEVCWSLGFEVTGPASHLGRELDVTADQVFAVELPGGVELGLDDSRSYPEWLQQPGAETSGGI